MDAYQLYLKGMFSFRKLTEEGLDQAVDFFLQALRRDPKYALARRSATRPAVSSMNETAI